MTKDALQEPVLVLNKVWMPIAVTTAREAVCDLFAGNATAVDPDTYITYTFKDWVERGVFPGKPVLNSPSVLFEVPEVIVLAEYDKVPTRTIRYSKRHIFKRDRMCCQYCGQQFEICDLTIDHVVPRSQGGETNWENCVTCCEPCNSKKADRTPEQAEMKLKSTPVRPDFAMYQHMRELTTRKPSWAVFIGGTA